MLLEVINRVVHSCWYQALFVHIFAPDGDKVIHRCGEIHAIRGISTDLAALEEGFGPNYTLVSYAQCG